MTDAGLVGAGGRGVRKRRKRRRKKRGGWSEGRDWLDLREGAGKANGKEGRGYRAKDKGGGGGVKEREVCFVIVVLRGCVSVCMCLCFFRA